MKLPRRNFLRLAVGAAALPTLSRVARAQAYPSRPITMIVPFPPGGLADVIGRIAAEGMRASLGQSIIIENVGGANGSIGTGRVARTAPDGYTLVLGIWNTHVGNAVTYSLQYDVVNDFAPIALLADAPLLLVAKKAIPANDLKELIAWLKANSDKASMGTVGAGSPGHLLGLLLQQEATKKHSALRDAAERKGPNSTSIRSANLPRPSMAGAFLHPREKRVSHF